MRSYWYKKDLTRKRLDKWMRSTLLKAIATSEDIALNLTPDASNMLKDRAAELSFETIRVIVMSKCKCLIEQVLPRITPELWLELFPRLSKEHWQHRSIVNLLDHVSPDVLKPLIPAVIQLMKDDWLSEYTIRDLVVLHPELWEAGRTIECAAHEMVELDQCPPETLVELVTRFPKLCENMHCNSNLEKYFKEGKIKLAIGGTDESQRTG